MPFHDLPWPFTFWQVKLVQIEQLHEKRYPDQRGKKERIRQHMVSHGYTFANAYEVAAIDTGTLHKRAFVDRTPPASIGMIAWRPASAHV